MIRAIVTALLPELADNIHQKHTIAGTVTYVEGQVKRMSVHLKLASFLLLLYLDFSSVPRRGQLFRFASDSHRRNRLGQWRNSQWRFQRDFIRLISSSAMLYYYDNGDTSLNHDKKSRVDCESQ